MHLRSLTLTTFAVPLLLAACSGDDNSAANASGGQVPLAGGTTTSQSTDGLQTTESMGNDSTDALGSATTEMGDGNVDGSSEAPDVNAGLQQQEDGAGSGNEAGTDETDASDTDETDTGIASDIIPIGTVENRGADCVVAALPDGNSLPISSNLPDPFTRLDGTRITEKSDWICRREEILQQAYKYIYGEKPSKPDSVTGTVTNNQVTVNIEHNGQTRSFTAGVSLPQGTGPFPAVISFSGGGPSNQMLAQGIAVINFNQGSVGGGNSGIFGAFYGNSSAGDLAAWAWGASRIIDVLETDSSVIDSTRLAVTGCSFLGKAAFAAGALDERFALTIPLESGIGGVASYKMVPEIEPNPTGSGEGPEQPQHAINSGWLPNGSLVGDFGRLPVDNHEVIGLIAPRGLLILGNTGGEGQFYRNLDYRTEYATAIAGKEIFAALGVENNVSYDSRNQTHCAYSAGFDQALQASVDKFLLGGSSATGTFTTDWEGVRTSPDPFIDWTTPDLAGEF